MSNRPFELRLRSTAAVMTSCVQGSTAIATAAASRLSRPTSRAGRGTLMGRCTFPPAAKPASTAAAISSAAPPSTLTSTKVPSRGRARRMLARSAAKSGQHPLDAFGDVHRRQRRAGDVADVLVELQRTLAALADELGEPARASDLAAIGLAVLQDLDAHHAAARIERDRVVDEQMLADHPVEHEQADDPPPGFRFPGPAGLRLDEARRRRKRELLRLRDRKVL